MLGRKLKKKKRLKTYVSSEKIREYRYVKAKKKKNPDRGKCSIQGRANIL